MVDEDVRQDGQEPGTGRDLLLLKQFKSSIAYLHGLLRVKTCYDGLTYPCDSTATRHALNVCE